MAIYQVGCCSEEDGGLGFQKGDLELKDSCHLSLRDQLKLHISAFSVIDQEWLNFLTSSNSY